MDRQIVQLTELNEDNWYECCQLNIHEDREAFIESNAISIAQSKFQPSLKTYAILIEDEIAGFVMFNSEKEKLDGHWIYRIMIDKKYQARGAGKAATELMIDEMLKLPDVTKIIAGYHPENKGAHHLYASLGFIDHGDRFGREMAVIKDINKHV
ncbi:GNAT family N-acetyltransferase [Jeotgalibacillus sp. R-1-5s-1]|uniref:GNAT family N-acetyltransferase n=1 Tax=Jeotgalibacillus sp. R-1-5s-1 TaxID=2555897 RepID=UPI00106C16F0|nr:GNAT family N-acetyltransferase [Jeotgalibacillus sp. R-1-5s-1]TFE00872.1 GNAT family N-acetyltransferase [Jeotgalibacillus sp. R-1-5s-1]